jgi:acetyl-CoA carboxylase biotin carboxyl carrier protein
MAERRTIKSPMPGTFYRRPSPGEDPFVNEGDRVSNGDVVGLVEVMKSFNEIKSDQEGVIDSFLVENEDAVEAGQDLVALDEE